MGTAEFVNAQYDTSTNKLKFNTFVSIPDGSKMDAIGICAMKLILADNPSETSKAKTWLITIIVALCLLFLADPIVTTISNLFSAA